MSDLSFGWTSGIRASHAGLYVCPGTGAHATFQLPTWELILVRQGRLLMWEEDRTFTVERGQTLLLAPGKRHGGSGAYGPDLSFYWLHFFSDRRRAAAHSATHVPQLSTPARPERIRELWHRFMQDYPVTALNARGADLLAVQILLEVALVPRAVRPTRGDQLAARASAVIDVSFHRPISAASVAGSLSRTVNYLGHAFRTATGQTVTDYILQRRIQEARLLLVTTNTPLRRIANDCGFASAAYFSRVFQRLQGVSPSRFRAMHAAATINVR